jgi:large subunit ribosomal protein L4
VSNDIIPASPKTKELYASLSELEANKILIITDSIDMNLELASRNIPNVAVTTTEDLSPVLLVGADKVILTSAALKQIEERLA